MRHILRTGFAWFIAALPPRLLQAVLTRAATERARTLSPTDGMRFLLGLDSALYPVQGELAVAYGGGIHTKHRHMRYHDFFVERIHPGERVLDIGCGIGAVAYDVAEQAGAIVVGIDQEPRNIRMATQRYGHAHVHYLIGDALQTLPRQTFDVVILSNVLEHLPDRAQFLQRVQATITPSRFLIRVPLFERDWRVPLKQELGVEWRLDITHETEYTLESFAEEMDAARLRIVHQEVRWGELWSELRAA